MREGKGRDERNSTYKKAKVRTWMEEWEWDGWSREKERKEDGRGREEEGKRKRKGGEREQKRVGETRERRKVNRERRRGEGSDVVDY